jgi:hypothetical protein
MHSNSEYAKLTQISTKEYDPEKGRPVAVLLQEVSQLEQETGLSFEQDVDDLGNFEWAAIRVGSGAEYALVHHEGSSEGVEVFGDPAVADIGELANGLGIPSSAFIDTRPGLNS